jgi:hypothetical protein
VWLARWIQLSVNWVSERQHLDTACLMLGSCNSRCNKVDVRGDRGRCHSQPTPIYRGVGGTVQSLHTIKGGLSRWVPQWTLQRELILPLGFVAVCPYQHEAKHIPSSPYNQQHGHCGRHASLPSYVSVVQTNRQSSQRQNLVSRSNHIHDYLYGCSQNATQTHS